MKKDKKNKQINIINELSRLLSEVNWAIAIPDENNTVNHLIIGKSESISEIVDQLGGDYTIMEKDRVN